jgi:hypothetical protein
MALDIPLENDMKAPCLLFFGIVSVAVCGALDAQTVYKCLAPNGVTVFSTEPCGKNAKKQRYQTLSADEEADRKRMSCLSAANDLRTKPDSANIDSARAEMDALSKSSHLGTPAENEAWTRNAQARMDNLRAQVRAAEAQNALQSAELATQQKKALADCTNRSGAMRHLEGLGG